MNLLDEIRLAQRDAGEAVVLKNLDRLGLIQHATAEEKAAVLRPAISDDDLLKRSHATGLHLATPGTGKQDAALLKFAHQLLSAYPEWVPAPMAAEQARAIWDQFDQGKVSGQELIRLVEKHHHIGGAA